MAAIKDMVGNYLRQSNRKETQYVNTVGFLRFFAAFCVLWNHLCIASPGFIAKGSVFAPSARLGEFGVEIFFIISGFIIPWSLWHAGYRIRKFGVYMLRRLVRLDPPYIATIILALCFNYYYAHNHGNTFVINYKGLLFHLGYLNVFLGYPWLVTVFWTLAIEFQYYIIIGITYDLFVSKNPLARYFAIFLFALPAIIPKAFYFPQQTILSYSHLFLLGILTFLIKKRVISWRMFTVLFIFVLSLGMLNSAGIVKALFWVGSIWMILFLDFQSRITNFLGKISYSLYLTHELFAGKVINYFASYSDKVAYKGAVLLIAVGVCVLCAYVLYLLVEKPSMYFSKKIR